MLLKSQIPATAFLRALSVAAMALLAGCPRPPAAGPGPVTSDPVSSGATAGDARDMSPAAHAGSFAENPIVYFVITDRFYNGNSQNDHSYGRQPDGEREIGTFHGGDLAGLKARLDDGYFRDLGINAIWITAPYEQIHGWVVGGEKEFRHYAYHGYYALDYTTLDNNMGTEDELRAFIDAAHAQGIRIIFDVVMNHPGYADLQTMNEYGVEVIWPGWEKATLQDYHSYFDYNNFNFTDWWGPDWVRAGLPGYQGGHSYDPLTMQLAYLPDFKTESDKAVEIPKFLAGKPDTRARTIPGYTVRKYLVKWLSDWVREYGVDGFRCDTAKHVEPASWAMLKDEAGRAYADWKAAHPGQAVDEGPFWMTGEVFPHGVERSAYFDHGFDSIINFDLQKAARAIVGAKGAGKPNAGKTGAGKPNAGKTGAGKPKLDTVALDGLYRDYADTMGADFNVLSYLSSHDTALFPRDRLIAGGTVLLLAPGGVQIFYGDESARPPGPVPSTDPQQATRSSMNWDAMDQDVLRHWQRLGTFRKRHVALARGEHRMLGQDPYVFARVHTRDQASDQMDDRVVVAIVASTASTAIPVADIFAEGATVRDAYTGARAQVKNGHVTVTPDKHGVVLLEALR